MQASFSTQSCLKDEVLDLDAILRASSSMDSNSIKSVSVAESHPFLDKMFNECKYKAEQSDKVFGRSFCGVEVKVNSFLPEYMVVLSTEKETIFINTEEGMMYCAPNNMVADFFLKKGLDLNV